MTVGGWVDFGMFAILIAGCAVGCAVSIDSKSGYIISVVAGIVLILALFSGMKWYYTNTASGQRAIVDQKSDFGGGIERTITIYTADGQVIAQYTGKIDIEGNDGGYLLFDYDGKRYTYYNCFVESIAEIGG